MSPCHVGQVQSSLYILYVWPQWANTSAPRVAIWDLTGICARRLCCVPVCVFFLGTKAVSSTALSSLDYSCSSGAEGESNGSGVDWLVDRSRVFQGVGSNRVTQSVKAFPPRPTVTHSPPSTHSSSHTLSASPPPASFSPSTSSSSSSTGRTEQTTRIP